MATDKNFVIKNGLTIGTTEVIDSSRNITSGAINSSGNITLAEYLYHSGDVDTNLRFQTDRVTLTSGGGASVDAHSNGNLYLTGTTVQVYGNYNSTGTITSGDITIGDGTTYKQSTDMLYVGGSGLDGADAAIYLGNHGSGGGYGWRFYYQGTGSGNLNKLIIRSENGGSQVDALTFNQDGSASFSGTISSGAITSTGSSQVANLTITGDLTVQGTTVTLDTATLNVEDKNITLNYSTGDSSASADGAGITIQDAVNSTTDATILWDATNDEFDFSHSANVTGSIIASGEIRADTQLKSDMIIGIQQTGSFIDFDDDTTEGTNGLTISSLSALSLKFDTNNNDTHGFNIYGNAQSTPYLRIDNSGNATFSGTISSGAITSSGDSIFTGSTSDNTSDVITAKDSSNVALFRVRNDGVVIVPDNYFYVTASAGAYFDGTVRVRNGITDDTGQLSLNSSTGDITFNSANLTSVGNITTENVHLERYQHGTVSTNVGKVQLISDAKTGWGTGDELGSIDWYTVDGSGIGARNVARIVGVNNQGNGSTTTTLEGELEFYTSAYNANLNSSAALLLDSSNNATFAGTISSGAITSSGSVDIAGDLNIASVIAHTGDLDTYFQFNAADTARIVVGGSQKFVVNSSGVSISNGTLNMNSGNLTSVGTITSGAIDSSGTSNFDSIQLTDASRLGFGTVKAGATVAHTASVDEGIFWHTTSNYGIYRTAGGWSSPFPVLKIQFDTGVEIDGGVAGAYGDINFSRSNLKMGGTQFLDQSRNLSANTVDAETLKANDSGTTPGTCKLHVGAINNASSSATAQIGGFIRAAAHYILHESAGSANSVFMSYTGGDTDFRTGEGSGATPSVLVNALKIGTTTVIDSSRNLTNIGTISSGTITSSGYLRTSGSGIFGNMSDEWQAANALRGGNFSADIGNDTTVLKLFPASQNDEAGNVRAAGDYNTGIAFMHLDPDTSGWGSGYTGAQAWIGLKVESLPGQEFDSFVIATNSSSTAGTMPTERFKISSTGAATFTGSATFDGSITASGGINGLDISNGISGNNFNITGVNQININDPGEGILFGTNCNLYLLDDANDNILRLDAPGGLRLHDGPLSIGTTTVIDTSRNLTNIGTATFAGLADFDSGITVSVGGSDRLSITGGDVNVVGATDLQIAGSSRRFSFTSGTGTVRTTTANSLILQTNSTTALTLDSSQNATFAGTISSGAISITQALADNQTALTITNGTSTAGDLGTQESFIDFTFLDANANNYPQVKIGAQVGQNADADSTIKEGSGAFVVHTSNAVDSIAGGQAGMAERFRVDYRGYVGIGTAAPVSPLHVESSNDQILTLNQSDSSTWNYIGFQNQGTRKWYTGINNAGQYVIGSDASSSITFTGITALQIDTTTFIDSSRNLTNIGSQSMSGNLYMNKSQPWIIISNTTEDGGGIVFTDNQAESPVSSASGPGTSSQAFRITYNCGNETLVMGHDDDSYAGFNFGAGGSLTCSGNVTAYSDERLKENIQTLDGKKALQMRGVSFTKEGKEGSGVIAQELEEIAPELVTTDKVNGIKSVAYGNLVGYLIEAVKEQQKQIEELKEEVSSLRSKN